MRCKECQSKILRKGNQIVLRKPCRRPFDSGKGTAYACSKCRLLHWTNGPKVMKLIVNGEEWVGPVYLAQDGITIIKTSGVAAT